MVKKNHYQPRRKFLQHSAMAGAGAFFTSSLPMGTLYDTNRWDENIKSKGYAAMDSSGRLSPWEFERRPVGDDDLLIDIRYASICHSDIHQMKGDWGPQQYPQIPGHEIVGVVAAVGRNVTNFKVGDRAGVGCMVDSCMECGSCNHGEEHFCERGETLFTY